MGRFLTDLLIHYNRADQLIRGVQPAWRMMLLALPAEELLLPLCQADYKSSGYCLYESPEESPSFSHKFLPLPKPLYSLIILLNMNLESGEMNST